MEYQEYLESKRFVSNPQGLEYTKPNAKLFGFQEAIVKWALKRGKAAIFADCGLGKTAMQLVWADNIKGRVLILAPLAVAEQTVQEGVKFGIAVNYCRSSAELTDGINITNYEMLEHFSAVDFEAVVLDESSILKSFNGSIRNLIIDMFKNTPFKLACTATPAPNDHMELGNHAEFLGIMSRTEMLATFFVHDGGETSKWRLKGHAQKDFWGWVCSWAVNIRKPSDIGFPDDGYDLPELKMHHHICRVDTPSDGFLFAVQASTLQERIVARRDSIADRIEKAAEIIMTKPNEQWLIWCNMNAESEGIAKQIRAAIEIKGSDKREHKGKTMMGFSAGDVQIIVTKPSIAGFGMNWQNCKNVMFLGLSDSYEQFYQALRRCWRFGQKNEVDCYIVTAETEGATLSNIKRKEQDAQTMANEMANEMHDFTIEQITGAATREHDVYNTSHEKGDNFDLYLGDCVENIKKLADESVHYSIFSPPFASLYTYSNSERDMGNCKDDADFMLHFQFLIKELHRVLKSGRLVSFHCMNLPTSKQNHGYIGIRDFRGELIKLFQNEGFIFHSEVCIWKDPVIAMQRTKALGLLHKQIKKDSAMSRQGIPDYLVTMRKAGDNPEPVSHTNESFPVGVWQKFASPVWMDINPSDTLQYRSAREHNDERHICPLQLQVISRGIDLWTNPNDVVLSPFAGIGSEGYQAVKMGRRFVGFELKQSYFNQAVKNLKAAGENTLQLSAIDFDSTDDGFDCEVA